MMPYKSKENKLAAIKRWKKDNPQKVATQQKRYRHRKHEDPKVKVIVEISYRKQYENNENRRLQRTYGICIDEYNQLFKQQDGKCAICGKHQTEEKKALSIDHCHATGKVRGLLCGNCNRAIGLLSDDIENLRCAIIYLNKSADIGHPL